MKGIVFLVILLTGQLFATGQIMFKRIYRLSAALEEKGLSVVQTPDGGYAVCGSSRNGIPDSVFIFKTDANGDSLWFTLVPGWLPSYDHIFVQTPDSGFIIWAVTEDPDSSRLIRINSNGTIVLNKLLPAPMNVYITSIAMTSDTSLIMAGTSKQGTVVMRTSVTGELIWSKTFIIWPDQNYNPYTVAVNILETDDGGILVSGNSASDFLYGGFNYIFLLKTSAAGDSLWTKAYPAIFPGTGADCNYEVNSAALVSGGGGYLSAGGILEFGPGAPTSYGLLFRTDETGDSMWTAIYDINPMYFNSVCISNNGGILLAGAEIQDTWLNKPLFIKTDDYGNTLFYRTYDLGESVSEVVCVNTTADGGYVMCGKHFPYPGILGVFLIKTDSSGNIWAEGVSGKQDGMEVSLFPNPSARAFRVESKDPIRLAEVYDASGSRVLQMTVAQDQKEVTLDLASLPQGFYLVKILTANGVGIRKAIKIN